MTHLTSDNGHRKHSFIYTRITWRRWRHLCLAPKIGKDHSKPSTVYTSTGPKIQEGCNDTFPTANQEDSNEKTYSNIGQAPNAVLVINLNLDVRAVWQYPTACCNHGGG